ncbi:aldehyde dehydrogenase family protein [Streptomyces winkii]|uniref:aldehyde dehydrogenase family protein n=1 Tax=Streptomyces winkii TaxID=3051178 RepID=UPI0028D26A6D|nr:aldehyde dehydrogenase family protein [Streptomyces sp. DSM 40971]
MKDITRALLPSIEQGRNPRTGSVTCTVAVTPPERVEKALAAASAAARAVGSLSPNSRARWLREIADALEEPDTATDLIATADQETALGETRLAGELARTAEQLRFYAQVACEGSYLGATIDRATAAAPSLARTRIPLGPVAVFGASNFPFAFGVLGNDTASALAAGCPVVVKGHPAHPGLSARLADLAARVLERVGAPDGTFALVTGFECGADLVRSEHISAVAFTGSQQGGQHLWRLANEREVVIPVFAEMGTVNPVVLTPAGAARKAEVAAGFVESFTGGAGQFCTKPGLLFAPSGSEFAADAARALGSCAPRAWCLTENIAASATTGVTELVEAGAIVVSQVAGPAHGWSVASTLLAAPIGAVRPGSRLLAECFGPVALVVEYDDMPQLLTVVTGLQGALAACVMSGGERDSDVGPLLEAVTPLVGRVVVDGWPTGVATAWGQQHGGPWPATTVPASTSIGAAALDRFTRPVTYQGAPDAALPPPVQSGNPWSLPRRVDGVVEVGGR